MRDAGRNNKEIPVAALVNHSIESERDVLGDHQSAFPDHIGQVSLILLGSLEAKNTEGPGAT